MNANSNILSVSHVTGTRLLSYISEFSLVYGDSELMIRVFPVAASDGPN